MLQFCMYIYTGACRPEAEAWCLATEKESRTESRKSAEREEKESQSARRPIQFSRRQQNVFSLSEKNALYLGFASEE